mmetsp:Transcript_113959/g.368222  ORF Transcript_113959/g.368222 Transcript_113959/m.368222 type:complete len:427 (-) Transcript_113959:1092-2372(-)
MPSARWSAKQHTNSPPLGNGCPALFLALQAGRMNAAPSAASGLVRPGLLDDCVGAAPVRFLDEGACGIRRAPGQHRLGVLQALDLHLAILGAQGVVHREEVAVGRGLLELLDEVVELLLLAQAVLLVLLDLAGLLADGAVQVRDGLFQVLDLLLGLLLELLELLLRLVLVLLGLLLVLLDALLDHLQDAHDALVLRLCTLVGLLPGRRWRRRGLAGVGQLGRLCLQKALLGLGVEVLHDLRRVAHELGRLLVVRVGLLPLLFLALADLLGLVQLCFDRHDLLLLLFDLRVELFDLLLQPSDLITELVNLARGLGRRAGVLGAGILAILLGLEVLLLLLLQQLHHAVDLLDNLLEVLGDLVGELRGQGCEAAVPGRARHLLQARGRAAPLLAGALGLRHAGAHLQQHVAPGAHGALEEVARVVAVKD